MSEMIKNLIGAIGSGSAVNTETAFNDVMADKISNRLDGMRSELAQSMFKEKEVEAEEPAEIIDEPVAEE
jgi:hypothetical protein